MKKNTLKVNNEFMKQLAKETGLTLDGPNEDRLFAETIHTNSKDMNKEEYSNMEREINEYSFQGKDFQVYAWNDESGYEYWNIKQEEDNYIQVTVPITGSDANAEEIKKAVARAYGKFSSYSRH